MDLAHYLRIQARANRLANHRLHGALGALPEAELRAPRPSFFGSLMATLEHILEVDGYYLGALHRDEGLDGYWDRVRPCAGLAELGERQRACDERLIAFCDALDAAAVERVVEMPRAAGRIQRDLAGHVLAHLFMHQVHHRGQVHGMLSMTAIAPPQLDEFLMSSEGHLREADMRALDWREEAIWGRPAYN